MARCNQVSIIFAIMLSEFSASRFILNDVGSSYRIVRKSSNTDSFVSKIKPKSVVEKSNSFFERCKRPFARSFSRR